MDTIEQSGARILVLASEVEAASDLCRMIQRSGMEARAATQLDDFVRAMRAWRPTHVAIGIELADGAGEDAQRVLADMPLDGMVVVRGPLDQSLIGVLRKEDTTGAAGPYAALRIERHGSRHGRRRADAQTQVQADGQTPVPTDRRRDPRTVRRAIQELDGALDEGQITVVYQPKVSAIDGSVTAVECLARWRRPDGVVVEPETFIALAEASGRIERLTEQVFARAMTWLGRELPDSPLRICLNLSAQSLADHDLADRVVDLCASTGLSADRIVLEVTETSAATDPEAASEVLAALRDLGVWVALDDFGAGHASLLQLARHPFTHLKIDRALVGTATTSQDSRAIIRAIVGLGRSLSLRIVAEGVEDRETLDVVTELGCEFIQGNYVSPPRDGDDLLAWMAGGGAGWLRHPSTHASGPP